MKLVSATFLPVQHAPSFLLGSLDALNHGASRFITDCKFSTHHCVFYKRLAWSLLFKGKCTATYWYIKLYWVIYIHICCLFNRNCLETIYYVLKSVIIFMHLLIELNLVKLLLNMLQRWTGIVYKWNWGYITWCLLVILKLLYII